MRILVATVGLTVLAGCSTLGTRTEINIEEKRLEVQKVIENDNSAFAPRVVRHLDYPVFTARRSVPVADDVPPVLRKGVHFADANPLTIQQVASQLQAKTGIPVRVQPDALLPLHMIGTAGVNPDPVLGTGNQNREITEDDYDKALVQYSGPIVGLLDLVAANFNLYWEFDDDAIVVGRYKTVVYRLSAVGGNITSSISVGGESGGEAGGQTGGEQSLSSEYSVSLWESVAASLESMLSGGGSITTSPATSAIIVTDTPDVQRRVAKYIESENTNLIRQVQVNIKVVSVTQRETSDYGFSLSGMFDNGKIGASFTTPAVQGVLSALTGQVIDASSEFNGTSAVINALQSVGDIQVTRDTSLVTLSNQPAQVRLVSERSYLAQVSSNITSGSDTISNELRPDTVSTGINLQVRPRTLPDDDQMVMQIGLDFSTLIALETVSSGSILSTLGGDDDDDAGAESQSASSIQVPNIDRRAFLNTVRLRSGDVLMLSGFKGDTDSRDKSGTGHASNILAGGARGSETESSTIVVLIEPRILGD